jgi:hypothetical protein
MRRGIRRSAAGLQIEHVRCIEARDNIQVKTVKQLLYTLDSDPAKRLPGRLQKQLMGSDGLRLLTAAMTILLTKLRRHNTVSHL